MTRNNGGGNSVVAANADVGSFGGAQPMDGCVNPFKQTF